MAGLLLIMLEGPSIEVSDLQDFALKFDCIIDGNRVPSETHVVCVKILSFPENRWYSPLLQEYQNGEISVLILESVEYANGTYRRIGVARISRQVQDLVWQVGKFIVI